MVKQHKPYVKHLRIAADKSGRAALGKSAGLIFSEMMDFIHDRQLVALEIHGERTEWIRGRGKRLTRRLVTRHDRLIVHMPKPKQIAMRFYGKPQLADQRRGGRRV